MTLFNEILFFLMISMVFVFNFNTETIMGISGNTWTNICILLFVFLWSSNILKIGRIMWNPIYTFAFLFVLLSFTSYIYSYSPDDTFDKVKTIIMVVLMAICIYQYIVLERHMDFVLKVYSSSGMIMALYIILKSDVSIGDRLGNVVGDANLVGITLSFSAAVALYVFIIQHRFLYLVQFFCIGYVIFLTGSRTAVLMLFLSVIVLLYTSAYIYHWKLKTVFLITMILIVTVYIMWKVIMKIPVLYDVLGIRIVSFLQISQGQHSINNEQSTQTRIMFAQRALDWFADSPIWGNGINSFLRYNNTFADGRLCFSHCNYTELLSGLGILGFIAYYGMFAYSLFYAWKSKNMIALKYKPLIYTLIIGICISDIGLVVYYEKCTWILIAIIAGIIYKMKRGERDELLDG